MAPTPAMTTDEEDDIVDAAIAKDRKLAADLVHAAKRADMSVDDMLFQAKQGFFRKHNKMVELVLLVYGDEFE